VRKVTLAIFDPNITATSPAGSCVLKMLLAAGRSYDLELFTRKTDLEASSGILIHRMPVLMKPVFVQSFLFTVMSCVFNLFAAKKDHRIKISTQGGFPFCDISYAHCCHRLFLTRYRSHITGGLLTRTARLINQYWSAWMEAIAFRHASMIVVPSQGLARELTAAYGAVVTPKLRVIANPVDFEAFSSGQEDRSGKSFTFAFCALGNFEWKGLGLILQALASGVQGNLKVIGGTNLEIERFQRLADSLEVSDRVRFVGMQTDIRPHLWTSHAFVFPSVYETFPLVCLQAAAAGLPLIATDLYGIEELLQTGVSGWRVERAVESLKDAMRAAFEDAGRTSDMGHRARELAGQYDVWSFQRRWVELLDQFNSSIIRS
jgi:glycosyltransferase involved in cell wall biosynthesis